MGDIVLLDDQTINKIAAGEVIERPANVVKEMVENSIDAGATSITIEVEKGGISSIRITDNGKGIAPDDIGLSFERHATSKIRKAEDLSKVMTMGFRGEALASIASVSKVTMTTRTKDNDYGIRVAVENGEIVSQEECGAPIGTTILVNELFYNTPVRYKFLKKDFTEGGYIEDAISRIALAHPEISFKLINNKKVVVHTTGNGDIKSVIYSIYGKDIASGLLDVNAEYEGINVVGVCGKPEIARSNRSNQLFYVNGRYIKDKLLSVAVDKSYGTLLHEGRYGFCILNILINPEQVDVNVHPAKLEVRFADENKVFSAINIAIKNALFSKDITVKNENVETVNEKQGFFDNYRPVKNEPISLANKIQNEKRNENVSTINFEKELNDLKQSFTGMKEESGSYSDDESEININKLNLNSTNDDLEISMSRFGLTDEDFNRIDKKEKSEKTEEIIEEKAQIHEDNTKQIEKVEEDHEPSLKELEAKAIFNLPNNEEKDSDSLISDVLNEEPQKQNKSNKTFDFDNSDDYINRGKLYEEKDSIGTLGNIPSVNSYSKEEQADIFKEILGIENKIEMPEYQIIGVAFLTYIFIQMNGEIYVFDQHAAHERVLYEKVKANYYKDGGRQSQMLLLPDIIELSKKDMKVVQEHIDLFKNAGFELEEFGENTIKITGVPEVCFEMNTRDLFLDIIDSMDITNKTTTEEIENRFIATVACKAAVKANMKLSEQEIKALFDELLLLENPFTCPHGRPTAIRFTKDEIEKKFKRKGF